MPPDSILPPPGVLDVLIVSAFAPELRGLRQQLGENLVGDVRGISVMAKTLGVGLPAASASMARRIWQLSPRAVVLVGSCGVYPGLSHYQPCDVVVASRITLLDHASIAGRAAFPEPMQTSIEPHAMLATGLSSSGARARAVPLATTLSITTDDVLAAGVYARTGCEAENLEAFGVALACLSTDVPFAAVLGVTNVVGARARDDWKTYERQAGIAATDVVLNWLHNGAAGLPHGQGRISNV